MRPNCLSEQDLQAFQWGDLPDDALNEVTAHLETCSRCEDLAAKLDAQLDGFLAAIRDPSAPRITAETSKWREAEDSKQTSADETLFRFLLPSAEPDEIGRLGNYRVLRLLGKGGMSYVFQAEDIALRRPVALKVMRPELSENPEGWQRFLREARIMAAIKHEHLVTVYQAGRENNVVYLAMELLHGESLRARMDRSSSMSVSDIVRLAREIASGLAVVHGQGLIHRDVKPDNIWLEAPRDNVKILDFGLARFVKDDLNLTSAGTVMGTPAFMSPEQARSEPIDARSDLFSLGAVLYFMCSGKKPFAGDSTMAVLTALAVDHPRPVQESNPAIPSDLSDLIMQLLDKDPAKRPESAEVVLQRLAQIERGIPASLLSRSSRQDASRRARARIPAWGWLALVLLACALPALLLWDRRSASPPKHEPAPVAPGVFLTDLQPIAQENWLPFIPRPPHLKKVENPEPVAVVVKKKSSPHGIFMHAPPPHIMKERDGDQTPRASLTYRLDKQYKDFTAEVSVNDGPPASEQPLTFTVYCDGKLLWQSTPVETQDDSQSVSVSVENVDELKIEITCSPGHVHGSGAVWVEPVLTK